MKIKKIFYVSLALVLVLGPNPLLAIAQELKPVTQEVLLPTIQDSLRQRIALDLRDMDVVDALKFLAMKADINIIAGKDVTGKVSLFLKNVTAQEALNIILRANALAYEIDEDVLYVMTEKEYKSIHGSNFSDKRQVKIISLKYAKPEAVFKAVDILKSDMGKVMVDEESGGVVLMDTPERIIQMEKAIKDFDKRTLTKTFVLKYAKAKDLEAILAKRLDAKKTGTVSVDERSGHLIVSAFPDRMDEIETLIKGMDGKTKQVLIEAKILKVILTDNFSMGVDWNKVWSEAKLKGLSFGGVFPFPAVQNVVPTNYFNIAGGGDNYNYTALVKILQTFGQTRNLSSPSIAVVNGQEAKILVGTTKAYVTTTVAAGSVSSTTAAQVSFIDVGVSLTLTPIINDDGYVNIKIKPEVSSTDGPGATYTIAPSVTNTVPEVTRTTAETTVLVKDGRTVVIGGLRKDEKVKTVNKLPMLGDIPFLGAAFRNKVETTEKTEIVVLITPHIITDDDQGSPAPQVNLDIKTPEPPETKVVMVTQEVTTTPVDQAKPIEPARRKSKGVRAYE